MQAIIAYNDADYGKAIQLWERLIPLHSPQTPDGKILLKAIASAQQKLLHFNHNAQLRDVSIPVLVEIDAQLQKRISKMATLFVYAKAISGPPMPLAIWRKQNCIFPRRVQLDSAMSMLPELNLSQFKRVKIFARISNSGEAMPHPGDLIGSVAANTRKHYLEPLVVKINKVIK